MPDFTTQAKTTKASSTSLLLSEMQDLPLQVIEQDAFMHLAVHLAMAIPLYLCCFH